MIFVRSLLLEASWMADSSRCTIVEATRKIATTEAKAASSFCDTFKLSRNMKPTSGRSRMSGMLALKGALG